jgi:RNA polymerase sigma-70 factor (ECF subfamily)
MPVPADIGSLVAAARAGDQDAFTALVEELAPELQAFVAARARSAAMVDEVVQNAFVTAWECLADYEARGSFAGWVKGIARNHLLEELRRVRRSLPDGDLAERLVVEDCLGDLERTDEQAESSRRLHDCLERLPERTQRLIRLRYWDDEPLADLAQRFHAPAETLAALLYRARKALLGCLEGSA